MDTSSLVGGYSGPGKHLMFVWKMLYTSLYDVMLPLIMYECTFECFNNHDAKWYKTKWYTIIMYMQCFQMVLDYTKILVVNYSLNEVNYFRLKLLKYVLSM